MNKRIRSLDSLRGLFILLVVVHHYYIKFGSSDLNNVPFGSVRIFKFIYEYGWVGVEYFFMLSGFGLCQKFHREYKGNICKFIIGRFNKLWLVAAIAELLNAAFSWKNISYTRLFKSIFFVQFGWISIDKKPYNGVAWFLDVLLICNIVFYLVYKLNSKYFDIYITCCVVMCVIGTGAIYGSNTLPFLFTWNGRGYLAFFVGVLISEIYIHVEKSKMQKWSIVNSVLAVFIYFISFRSGLKTAIGGASDFRFMLSMFFFPTLFILLLSNDRIDKLLSGKLLQAGGKMATYVFLFQPFIYLCVDAVNQKLGVFDTSRLRGEILVIVTLYIAAFFCMKIFDRLNILMSVGMVNGQHE